MCCSAYFVEFWRLYRHFGLRDQVGAGITWVAAECRGSQANRLMCSSRAASKRAGKQVPCELIDACSPDDLQDPGHTFDWIADQAATRRLLDGIQVDDANDIQVDGTDNAQGDGTNKLQLQSELGVSRVISQCRAVNQWHLSRLAMLMATSCLFQMIHHRFK